MTHALEHARPQTYHLIFDKSSSIARKYVCNTQRLNEDIHNTCPAFRLLSVVLHVVGISESSTGLSLASLSDNLRVMLYGVILRTEGSVQSRRLLMCQYMNRERAL